jgi:PleD family two-component response regulator
MDIENTSFMNQIKMTVSIGVGQFATLEKETEFFDRVDKALYRAKKQGRNCVVVDYTAK